VASDAAVHDVRDRGWPVGRNSRLALLAATLAATVAAATLAPSTGAGAATASPPPPALAAGLADLTAHQWDLGAANAPAAWPVSRGAGVVVAVIDTGVDATHPDLAGHVVPGGVVDAQGRIVPASLTATGDGEGHGTHVAGIVAASDDHHGVTGIAPDARIMPVRIFTPANADDDEATFLLTLAHGIRFATAHGAGVINMSVGAETSGMSGPYSAAVASAAKEVCRAVADAVDHDTVVVAAAGNDGAGPNPALAPAGCPQAMTVAAVDESLRRAYFSSYDGDITLAAPGVDVLSSVPAAFVAKGAPRFALMSGTSMASPAVAGAAALVKAAHPDWTVAQVRDALTATAQDVGPRGKDVQYGYGLVDAAAALGVDAPRAAPNNYFAVQAVPTYDPLSGVEDVGRAELGWTPPQADTPTGYTVRVFHGAAVRAVDLPGDAVRADTSLAVGDWYDVTAHYPTGDVTTYPGVWAPMVPEIVARPAPVRHPTALRRPDGSITVRWTRPTSTAHVKWIHVAVRLADGTTRNLTLPVRPGAAFPTTATVRLPAAQAAYVDAHVVVATVNSSSDGFDVVETPTAVPTALAAPRGLHIVAIDSAGRGHVVVRGTVSQANARRVCHNSTCAGRAVTVTVAVGRHRVAVRGRLTSKGTFYLPMRLVTRSRTVKAVATSLPLSSGWQTVALR
jgi:subtilisin family serine protease